MSLDTGVIAHVPEDLRIDVDEGEEANALDGGSDDLLDDIYDNPGVLVPDDLG